MFTKQVKDQGLKHTVPKLAADGNNWVIYCDCLLWVLDTNSLIEYLQSNPTLSSYTTAGTIRSLMPNQHWKKEEGMVKQIIGATIPDLAFNCVKGRTSAKDVWAVLKKMYKERTKILMAGMMQCFCNKCCGPVEILTMCAPILRNFLSSGEQLAAMGKDINDETMLVMVQLALMLENHGDMCRYLMKGLGELPEGRSEGKSPRMGAGEPLKGSVP